jgi:hypothetical protein
MKFKDDVIAARFKDMCELAQKIATEMDEWTQKNYGIEITLTATTSCSAEDKELNRVSDTHRTRRAWDIRVKDLPDSLIAELCAYFRKKYARFGAVASGAPQIIVYKPHGTGPHLHCQLNRKYALKEIDYGKKD